MDGDHQGTPDERPWFLRLPRRWLRRALLRVGLLAAVAVVLAGRVGRFPALLVAFLGLLAAAGAVIEGLAEDRLATWRVRLEACGLALVVGTPLGVLALSQAVYVDGVLLGGIDAGYASVQAELGSPAALAGGGLALACVFVLVLFVRLRHARLSQQVGAAGVYLALVAAAVFVALLRAEPSAPRGGLADVLQFVIGWIPGCAVLLAVFRLADVIDGRLRGAP